MIELQVGGLLVKEKIADEESYVKPAIAVIESIHKSSVIYRYICGDIFSEYPQNNVRSRTIKEIEKMIDEKTFKYYPVVK